MKAITFVTVMCLAVLFSSAVLADKGPDYDQAVKYYDSGKYQESVKIFREYVKKRPDAAAYYRIGYGLYKMGKHSEAEGYFRQAYLIDPAFSPQPEGAPRKYPKKGMRITRGMSQIDDQTKSKQPLSGTQEKVLSPKPESVAGTSTPLKSPANKDRLASSAPTGKSLTPSPTPSPQRVPQEPESPPITPSPVMPGAAPGIVAAILAGFGMLLLLPAIAFYVYFSLCLFLIAKKLNVPNPWIAWIPVACVWTFVSCAAKPWWWILLFFVPFVNLFVGIYLWITVTENLGRNKWLGLLMLLPVINFVFLGVLAFSKSETSGMSLETETPA